MSQVKAHRFPGIMHIITGWQSKVFSPLQQFCSVYLLRVPGEGHRYVMDPLLKLLLFSLVMFALPFSVFFAGVRGDLDGLLLPVLGAEALSRYRTIIAGVFAVLMVNAVCIAYIIMAFNETKPAISDKKQE